MLNISKQEFFCHRKSFGDNENLMVNSLISDKNSCPIYQEKQVSFLIDILITSLKFKICVY